MMGGLPAGEVQRLRQVVPTAARPPPSGGAAHRARDHPGRRQRRLRGHRSKDPGQRDQHHLRGLHRLAAARRRNARRRSRPVFAQPGQNQLADMLSGMTVIPGVGIDFAALANILLVLSGAVRRQRVFLAGCRRYIMAGVTQRTVYRLRRGRRHQAGPAAAQVLRRPLARRRAQPRHQRHRQHRPDAPAEPDPADHVRADRHRRDDHDVHDQLGAGAHLIACYPASLIVTVIIIRRSQTLFVAQWASTGTTQRAGRGDAHRPQHRDHLRAPGRGGRASSKTRTSGSTRPHTVPSSSRASSSRRST